MDLLDQIENSLDAYKHARGLGNDRSAFAQRLHIEQNCVSWMRDLVAECRAYRKFSMTADTVATLVKTHEGKPLKLIYMCSPYKGNKKANIAAARQYCFNAIANGYIPIAPHVMFYDILDDDDPGQRAVGMKMGIELLRFCSEVWVFGSRISDGMLKEIVLAQTLKIPVRRMDE
nr:DUF4406 domain-containing protein [uncultured Caproiciproducens sp.]